MCKSQRIPERHACGTNDRFKCPCGQYLQLPPDRIAQMNQQRQRQPRTPQRAAAPPQQLPQRMRCPNCTNILLAPVGVPRFRCPTCTVILAPPVQTNTPSTAAPRNTVVTAKRPKNRNDLNLDDLSIVVAKAFSDDSESGAASSKSKSKWEGSVSSDGTRIQWQCAEEIQGNLAFIRSWSFENGGTLTWHTAKDGYACKGLQLPPNWYWTNMQQVAKHPFGPKLKWFRKYVAQLQTKWDDGHHKIIVRRAHLLEDSTAKFMSKKPADFRMIFRFKFHNEPALDAGGVAREWFDQLTATLFNLDFGLFSFCKASGKYTINDSSDIANDGHLHYFHFAGRLLGKALFSGQLVDAHLAKPLFKLIIGLPIELDDMKELDPEYHQNFKAVIDMEEDVDDLCLSFDVRKTVFGAPITIPLKPGGSDIEVDDDNKQEYVDLMFKYYMFERIKVQLEKLLLGFYEVIPPFLVAIFTPEELELLVCGLPSVDVDDWKKHMRYFGEFNAKHKVVRWFFECVKEFNNEDRGKLLRFTTGSSSVPVEGFKALQSHDGKLCWFALKSIPRANNPFPIAHTCFNRLDLPLYTSKSELKEKLLAVSNIPANSMDFGIE